MMKDFSEINERILYIIEIQTNGNKKKFAERIGFAPQVVSNIVSGRKTKPSFDVLEAIITSFDDVNPGWLLTGKGSIIKKTENKSNNQIITGYNNIQAGGEIHPSKQESNPNKEKEIIELKKQIKKKDETIEKLISQIEKLISKLKD